ncbi:MAG TPA: lysylphosphatidylglycerol synthase domain-containing protein, partial [Candidatus Acidoferrales bacterium]|nr:lysylphosphatidylglycerol synthase domain-containing protein [Candidatus Acidoferrales bacterium]
MRRVWRKILWLLVGLLIVAALLYRFRGATALGGFSWGKLGGTLSSANIFLLILATASIYVSYAIRALRWVSFSRHMGRPTFSNVYSATIMGFAAIFLLGRAGEPVRPLLIARKD